jgi:hypothetical protein
MSRTTSKPARGGKSSAIRDALRSHPGLGNKGIAEYLTSKGIKCSSQDVANQKARLKRLGMLGGKASFSLEDLKKVKSMVADAGGLKQVQALLKSVDDLADQVGGMDKLRRGLQELPELMSN